MSRDVDEDLIEATIRRVAEQKAASEAAQPYETEDEPLAADAADAREDLIEDTIRRVAAQKAALQAARPAESDEKPIMSEARESQEDLIEATIRRVAEQQAQNLAEAQPEDDDDDPVGAAIAHAETVTAPVPPSAEAAEEDPIEAAIRRVAEAKVVKDAEAAAEQAAPSVEPTPAFEGVEPMAPRAADVEEDPIEATIRRVAQQQEARIAEAEAPHRLEEPVSYRQPPIIESQPAPISSAASTGGWEEAVARLEGEIRQTNREMQSLASRVDALIPLLGRMASVAEQPAATARPTIVPPSALQPIAADDEDWDVAPELPRIPLGTPPRPAIMRDPSPMTATAAKLEPVADEEPAPAAFEPARPAPVPQPAPEVVAGPEPRRGFDLLPRTYRITVEDKRRGVDLVPLHRALLGMDGVKDMSLLSYSNGVAIVAIETTLTVDPDVLGKAVSRAMAREVKVEVHNDTTMVVKLAED